MIILPAARYGLFGSPNHASLPTLQLTNGVHTPQSQIAAGNTGICRRAVYARTNITSLQFIFPGWFCSQAAGFLNQEVPTGNYTVSTWIEVSAGTYVPVDVNLTVVSGGNTVGGTLTVSIPKNTRFFIWTWASGQFPYYTDTVLSNSVLWTDEFCNINTSGVATAPSGSPTDNGTRKRMMVPIAVVGPSAANGVATALIGDSRTTGTNDTAVDNSSDRGNLARSVGPTYPYLNLGVGGDEPSEWIAAGANRRALARSYCTHIVDELGINLFNNRGMTNANGAWAFKQRVAPFFTGKKYVMTTLEPKASSTDSFVTAANQTVLLPERANFNTNVKALSNYVDINGPVEDGSNLGKWLSSGGAITTDGLHPTNAGYEDQAATATAIIAAINAAGVVAASQPVADMTGLASANAPTYDTSTQKFGTGCLSGGGAYALGIYPGSVPRTMECWFKGSAAGAGNNIRIIASGNCQICVYASGFVGFRDTAGANTISTTVVTDGNWHHFALTINSTTMNLWCDGALAATKAIAIAAAENTGVFAVHFDTNTASPTMGPACSIDEVALFNTERYTGTFTPPVAAYAGNESGLMAVWHFNSSLAGVLGPVLTT